LGFFDQCHSQPNAVTGIRILASPKIISYFSSLPFLTTLSQTYLPGTNFPFPDYTYSSKNVSADLNSLSVTVQNITSVSVTFGPNTGLNFKFVNVSVFVTWNLNWNSTAGKGALASNSTVFFDLSVTVNVTSINIFANNQPNIGFIPSTFHAVNIRFVTQNYPLPPELQSLPKTALNQYIMNNMSSPLLSSLNNNIIPTAWTGYFPFFEGIAPAFLYFPINPPSFTNDTMVLEISGDIILFPGTYICDLPHVLPPIPVRTHDIELEISMDCFTCLFHQLLQDKTLLTPVISQKLFGQNGNFSIGYNYPFDPNNVTFVPVTNSDKVSVTVTPVNVTVTVLFNGVSFVSISPVAKLNLQIALLPGAIMANVTAVVDSFTAVVTNYTLVSPVYAQKILNEDTASLVNQINSLIPSPISLTIQNDFLKQLWNDITAPSFTAVPHSVIFQTDLKQ